jgi:hypothetical protein
MKWPHYRPKQESVAGCLPPKPGQMRGRKARFLPSSPGITPRSKLQLRTQCVRKITLDAYRPTTGAELSPRLTLTAPENDESRSVERDHEAPLPGFEPGFPP